MASFRLTFVGELCWDILRLSKLLGRTRGSPHPKTFQSRLIVEGQRPFAPRGAAAEPGPIKLHEPIAGGVCWRVRLCVGFDCGNTGGAHAVQWRPARLSARDRRVTSSSGAYSKSPSRVRFRANRTLSRHGPRTESDPNLTLPTARGRRIILRRLALQRDAIADQS